jgi:hypothetical protein
MVENLIQETLTKAQQEPDNPFIVENSASSIAKRVNTTRAAISRGAVCGRIRWRPTLEKEINDIKGKRITAKITEKKAELAANHQRRRH